MVYGYARCSTKKGSKDFDRQRTKLQKLGVDDNNIRLGYESESIAECNELKRLLSDIKQGDTIITTKVSYLANTTKQLCDIIELVKDYHLKLIIGTLVMDCTKEPDPITQGMIEMWRAFKDIEREKERTIRSQRALAGLATAKSRGNKQGRPPTTIDDFPKPFYEHIDDYLFYKKITLSELADICGVTRQTMSKYVRIYNKYDNKASNDFEIRTAIKDLKKEEKENRHIDIEELRILALQEEATVWQEGISAEYTPYTYELQKAERKRKKADEAMYEKYYAEEKAEQEKRLYDKLSKELEDL